MTSLLRIFVVVYQSFFYLYIYLYFIFWLRRVSAAARGLSLVAVNRGDSVLQCVAFSLL